MWAPQFIRLEFDECLVGDELFSVSATERSATATAAKKAIIPTHAVHEKRSMHI